MTSTENFAPLPDRLSALLRYTEPIAWLAKCDEKPIALTLVDSLIPGDTPRLEGVDVTYAEKLSHLEVNLPPILVQRSSMRVIDGMHRLQAAHLSGQQKINVRFLDCDEDEAFLLAVAANSTHGMPLTSEEKRAAATRIISIRPDASDRWVAQISGLSAPTVAAIRQSNIKTIPIPDRRIGRDGRIRPLNATNGRRLARDILSDDPDASLRQIAREAGVSVGTARDVREKMRLGIDPLETRRAKLKKPEDHYRAEVRDGSGPIDLRSTLQRLQRDPSLRYTESGKFFLRWLFPRLIKVSDWEPIIDAIPARWVSEIACIAHSCAEAWASLAKELENRDRK